MSSDNYSDQRPLTKEEIRVVREKLKRAEDSGFTDQGLQEILKEIKSR